MLRSFGAKPSSIRQKKIIQSWVTFFGLNFPPSLTEHAGVVFSGWPCEVWTKPTVASLGHVTCVKQEEFPTGNPHPMPSLNPELFEIWETVWEANIQILVEKSVIQRGWVFLPPHPADPPTKKHRIFISGKKSA